MTKNGLFTQLGIFLKKSLAVARSREKFKYEFREYISKVY